MYNLTITMNNEVLKEQTDDLKGSFLKFKPEDIHTEVYITIDKDGSDFTKHFALRDAVKLFRDEDQLDMFLNTYNSLYF